MAAADAGSADWREWGPYVADRAWGSVREDYSADGNAWGSFPFEHAASRTYRWNEDGLLAWCDRGQSLCLGLALWNGADPILKERPFGLSGPQGNHGEDAKDYWWYVDSTPTHSWSRARYAYPTSRFPYEDLVATNAGRERTEPEYELIDTGVFTDDRYVMVTVDVAKADPRDLCVRIIVDNRGPDPVTVHVLPSVWFRNIWSWAEQSGDRPKLWDSPQGNAGSSVLRGRHSALGDFAVVSSGPGDAPPEIVCCENETNVHRLYGAEEFAGAPATAFPKDGINDHVIGGAATANPAREGTKAAFHHVLQLAPRGTAEIRVRLTVGSDSVAEGALGDEFEAVMTAREGEADAYWADVTSGLAAGQADVARRALAGLLSCKQFYAYDVSRWLAGDPLQPPSPGSRLTGRNSGWQHVVASDVIVMPDSWEYPWFAAWDLAFHCVALSHVDPALAKEQLLLLLHEWFQHPAGQLPAYEWNFSDVNPPVHAWAALQIYRINGERDTDFLERVMHRLLINFTWWVNRKDVEGDNLFEGGFLGLDNIGPIDRSQAIGDGEVLEQSDGTAWMASYCLQLLEITTCLARVDPTYGGLATKFLDHFCSIAAAANDLGLWDEEDGFYYDRLRESDGTSWPVRVRSAVGLIPLLAVSELSAETLAAIPELAGRLDWLRANRPAQAEQIRFDGAEGRELLAIATPERLARVLARVLDEGEFLSPYGIRSLSAAYREQPATVQVGGQTHQVDYEPAESTTPLFGGNSNWRGPVWFPINALLVGALRRYGDYCGADLTVEHPTGSGRQLRLGEVADDLTARLVGLFLRGADGQRPCQRGLPWQDDVLFNEYFHGDTGLGLGASHQTGWTSLVASLLLGWPR